MLKTGSSSNCLCISCACAFFIAAYIHRFMSIPWCSVDDGLVVEALELWLFGCECQVLPGAGRFVSQPHITLLSLRRPAGNGDLALHAGSSWGWMDVDCPCPSHLRLLVALYPLPPPHY